ncbi:MAG: trypsin-like peptidase domain-containing protein [Chloroflexi bacterium]|nr:trypsin-like peptidase domain-containing protein [Chloroflexota bacterium]MYJ91638.1 trypsin-like peptidase domain-containing protein [Chloroflexota bacterium]
MHFPKPLAFAAAVVVAILAVGVAVLAVNVGSAQEPGSAQPSYEFSGQILTRVDEFGRLELCLRTEDGQVLCPEARFVRPDRARTDRWIASSEVEWTAAIEPERIVYPIREGSGIGSSATCEIDAERMLSATWQVETSRSRATAFHIGEGRFITAYHAVNGKPPFVSLIHGERTIGAVVLGTDPQFDLALLEVVNPELVSDVPAMRLRAPTSDDVGQPVYVVGYPGGEALTFSGGGTVIQVWDDNIQTSSAIRSGNSGGPMFDACGDVIGVLWAGSSSWAYTFSGQALQKSLKRIRDQWPTMPRLPENLPATLRAADRLVWHYGPEPPQDVDCSELDADWWIGVSGIADEAEVRADLERSGWRQVGVCGADGPDDFDNGYTYVAALRPVDPFAALPEDCSGDGVFFVDTVLFDDPQAFGSIRLTTNGLGPLCPDMRRYSLLIAFDDPLVAGSDLGATLVGADGSLQVGRWQQRSFASLDGAPDRLVTTFWQEWTAPAEFDPVALRLALGANRLLLPLREGLPQASAAGTQFATIEQRAQIVVRIDGESGAVRTCLRMPDGVHCSPDGGVVDYPGHVGRWRESLPIGWTTTVPTELTALPQHVSQPVLSCAYQGPEHFFAWQFNSLAGSGTAVYVGDRQFVVNGAQVPDGAPWGVVSRGAQSHAVIRVARDPRNDLALVELVDTEAEVELGRAARIGSTGEDMVGGNVYLLSYPSGNAERFHLTVLEVTSVTDRVFRVDPTGIRRHGAPLVDLCTHELVGISIGGDDLLRAETVAGSLELMRSEAERPYFDQDGPPAHGMAAVLGQPLYAGPVQPQFSGRICAIHPSERYEQHYAVYASNVDDPDVWRVYEQDGSRPATCDFGDKIFIVEYRADEPPEAVCIEPRRPLSPVSTVEVELEAPDGVELLLAREFVRDDCPGLSTLEQSRWFSTHYFKLRNTGRHDFEDMTVRVYNEEDQRYIPRRDVVSFADADVRAWRVRVRDGAPVKIVVTVR